LEPTSRKYGVTVVALSQWREAYLAAGEADLKIRQEDLAGEQARRMTSVIAELAMENELLRSAAGTGKTRGVSCGGLRIGPMQVLGRCQSKPNLCPQEESHRGCRSRGSPDWTTAPIEALNCTRSASTGRIYR
jgi:hypothetical protein